MPRISTKELTRRIEELQMSLEGNSDEEIQLKLEKIQQIRDRIVENYEWRKAYRIQYHKENREKILASSYAWKRNNPDKVKQMYEKARVRTSARAKQWRAENRKARNDRIKEKRKNNPQFRLRMSLTARMNLALIKQRGLKSANSEYLVGCSWLEARQYIESLFLPGMSWENYGEWHIDHIIPCNAFKLTEEEQQQKCFHYTNLRPLWAKDNLEKADRLLDGDLARNFDKGIGMKFISNDCETTSPKI